MAYLDLRNILSLQRPDLNLALLDEAYAFAKVSHEGQQRYSGEPYLVHPVAVAEILLPLNPDLTTLQAALLHDVLEGTGVSLAALEKQFGSEVSGLVEGMNRLSVVKIRKEDTEAEKWKKMFLAMAKDVRIVFIKLAERLHNMRTLEFVPQEKQERIARESLLVHAAIASRLGLYSIKSELEDLCFKYLYPQAYEDLLAQVASQRARSEKGMEFAVSNLEQFLVREGIKVEKIQGRFKHLWSLYQKMEKKEKFSLDSIYDLFAVRILLPDHYEKGEEELSSLYATISLIHQKFVPLPGRFKDYVAVPKPNGYRSLHTTVLGLGGDLYDEATEVQIRTLQMHRESELGIASHWAYKMGNGSQKSALTPQQQKMVRETVRRIQLMVKVEPDLLTWVQPWLEDFQHMFPSDRSKVEELLLKRGIDEEKLTCIRKARSMGPLHLHPQVEEQLAWLRGLSETGEVSSEMDVYPDRIFVLTPKRQVLELPRGSTPIDFAYRVHTELGHKLLNAKANGRIVPLDYELQNGDVLEITTRSNAKPNRYWYSIAKTTAAKAKIRNWFNSQDKELNLLAGRELRESPSLEAPLLVEKEEPKAKLAGPSSPSFSQKVLVTEEENLPVILSACCKPKAPCPLIAYVTRGHSIRIHRLSCRELSGLDGQRFVSAVWKELGAS
ncbi:bifunctional (p)ppGpp synthetase/guanosine-3',5'-bis(diphosphate) 3'-pyrophosphohydrolase [Candidatus Peregrinibacteria bacterium]|nr:MAG: bifunctional (p)ppGpp synthetase/guanosine-3',5'-bis(diphosphate) 3'-pyrophosphohydrolase [Candidatus Peregrinibacteria bacterium]